MNRKIEVQCYSGYKGNESPQAFVCEGKKYQIKEIIEQENVEDMSSRERKRIFVVRLSDGSIRRILFAEKDSQWFLESYDSSI